MQIFFFVDFTKVKETEKEKLEHKFKHIFHSSISHNLKTPLNSNHSILYKLFSIGLVMSNVILEKRISPGDDVSK